MDFSVFLSEFTSDEVVLLGGKNVELMIKFKVPTALPTKYRTLSQFKITFASWFSVKKKKKKNPPVLTI